jgi:carboxymethylenebutenolidase
MATLAADLTDRQRAMLDVWLRHLAAEFETHDVAATLATMTAHPINVNVPLLSGGAGAEAVRAYYAEQFIPKNPPDTAITLLSRTIGSDRLVDELIFAFTHTREMDWMLPGIAPTGRRVEVPLVVIVEFQGDQIASEHVYWDQASVLVQLGLLPREGLPITGAESASKLRELASPGG